MHDVEEKIFRKKNDYLGDSHIKLKINESTDEEIDTEIEIFSKKRKSKKGCILITILLLGIICSGSYFFYIQNKMIRSIKNTNERFETKIFELEESLKNIQRKLSKKDNFTKEQKEIEKKDNFIKKPKEIEKKTPINLLKFLRENLTKKNINISEIKINKKDNGITIKRGQYKFFSHAFIKLWWQNGYQGLGELWHIEKKSNGFALRGDGAESSYYLSHANDELKLIKGFNGDDEIWTK